MKTDTSEKGLEALIEAGMLARGWIPSVPKDYDREYCVDLAQLAAFLRETQPDAAESLGLEEDLSLIHI